MKAFKPIFHVFILGLLLFHFHIWACDFSYKKLPDDLSQTCLYSNFSKKIINPKVHAFSPKYPLWSDGAEKKRYIYLPEGKQINSENPNLWDFPVGTVFFKEFSKNGRLLETRLLKRVSSNKKYDWIFGTYVWNYAQKIAKLSDKSVSNLWNTGHDVPSRQQCFSCHGIEKFHKKPDGTNDELRDLRPLGFNALDLSGESAPLESCKEFWKGHGEQPQNTIDLKWLLREQKLSHNHQWDLENPEIPGQDIQAAALGYMHNNCGSCHATSLLGDGWVGTASFVEMHLRADIMQTDPNKWPAFMSLVNQPTSYYRIYEIKSPHDQKQVLRINTISPQDSAVLNRFLSEIPGEKMPPSGARKIDPYGACVLKEWTKALAKSAGAPK